MRADLDLLTCAYDMTRATAAWLVGGAPLNLLSVERGYESDLDGF